jgi:hypothetical protein
MAGVTDQVSENCLDVDSAAANGRCMCGKRAKAGACPSPLDSCFRVVRGMQGAKNGECLGKGGGPLYIQDVLLQGLSINRVSMLHFETMVLMYPPPRPFLTIYTLYIFIVSCTYYFFQEKKSLGCSSACVYPLCMPLRPNLHPERLVLTISRCLSRKY